MALVVFEGAVAQQHSVTFQQMKPVLLWESKLRVSFRSIRNHREDAEKRKIKHNWMFQEIILKKKKIGFL